MKSFSANNKDWIVAPIKDDGRTFTEFDISFYNDELFLSGATIYYHWVAYEKLPTGNYKIIGLAFSLTEEQCADVVELANDQMVDVKGIMHYKDYLAESWEQDYPTAKESLMSLMKSMGIDKGLLILKDGKNV